MKKLAKAIAATMMSVALVFGATIPASAGTKSGTHSCASIARSAVRGEQQRFATMILTLAGSTVYNQYGEYVGWGYTESGGTKTWSASSPWLLWKGSYGACAPKIIY